MDFSELEDLFAGKNLQNVSDEMVDRQWIDHSKYKEMKNLDKILKEIFDSIIGREEQLNKNFLLLNVLISSSMKHSV